MSQRDQSRPSPVTRRAFLKTASGATAAAALTGPFPATVNVARAQSREIKVGIVSAYSGVFSVIG
ncbi:MAG: twin-arginine translocation signal domain-containing protein, partial [Candidatus Rokubacteria bacterium]|nr:twin-arginine translocation signal domain-containing protein [Candidatus Rokubacteria bacterium]